ncbi:S9 family peptidase [Myroides marinus]|uniref:alpha/beta hydrolase family protein n=1 Tax=Myroides marinus TaxID=703342 RepID=UPI002578096F|nr:prolyl oligopeptidase family serine peptidase [Myroides marinus]MDM1405551.1 S9 family peptidase [Myroides marinus]
MTTRTLNFIYSLILIFLGCLTCYSQIIKDSTDYSRLNNTLLSSSGKFSVVNKYFLFDSKKDSVFIFNHNAKLLLAKPTNNRFEFLKNDMLIEINSSETEIVFFDPNTSKSESILNVSELQVINNLNLIFYLDTKTNLYKLIRVLPSKSKEIWSESKSTVNFIGISDNKQHLFIQYSDFTKGIELINLESLKKTINTSINDSIKSVIWDKKLPVVFLSPNKKHDNKFPYLTFFNYNTNLVKKQELDSQVTFRSPEATNEHAFKIIQYINLVRKPYNTEKLQVWTTKDTELATTINYPNLKKIGTDGHIIFDYKQRKVYQPDTLNKNISIVLKENTLLAYNPNQYIDYSHSEPARPRDISIYDIKEDKFSLIVKAQANPFNSTSLSSKANYFIYIKKGIMHIYNIELRTLENSFDLKEDTTRPRTYTSRLRYWSKDEQYFYFTSGNDLMQYNTKNKAFRVLINGGNTNYHYKILNTQAQDFHNQAGQIPSNTILDNSKLLIERYNIKEATTSILLLEGDKTTPIINNTRDRVSTINYSDDFKTVTYTLENFNKPALIYIYHHGKNRPLLENSMPQKLYTWKKQKIVSYKDKYNNDLKGILFYPKEFDSNKKYPMITNIYEIQYHHLNKFSYISYTNSTGFNIDLYLENNYFVFLPDILDTKQGTGLSALHCVEESIKTVLQEEKAIDKNNLGLYGFSHGGYETNFIITQTDIFKTAVSGAGNSDIIRSYFSYNKNFNSPFFFQYENGQYNMSKTFKEDKELYLRNSPILYADQVKTPLLAFTGEEDHNIHWEQQKEFFIALLRYNIPHIALFYKNEGHSLSIRENQIDITNRMINWFDYFLKDVDNKETRWIKYYTRIEKEKLINN